MSTELTPAIVTECKAKLLDTKIQLLSQIKDQRADLANRQFSGDEGDLSSQAVDETQLYIRNRRARERLLEVELALARIEQGIYGICEETHQPIELDRILAIPWTRLSIEGAELREAMGNQRSS